MFHDGQACVYEVEKYVAVFWNDGCTTRRARYSIRERQPEVRSFGQGVVAIDYTARAAVAAAKQHLAEVQA
jgi:hypothetical protein